MIKLSVLLPVCNESRLRMTGANVRPGLPVPLVQFLDPILPDMSLSLLVVARIPRVW